MCNALCCILLYLHWVWHVPILPFPLISTLGVACANRLPSPPLLSILDGACVNLFLFIHHICWVWHVALYQYPPGMACASSPPPLLSMLGVACTPDKSALSYSSSINCYWLGAEFVGFPVFISLCWIKNILCIPAGDLTCWPQQSFTLQVWSPPGGEERWRAPTYWLSVMEDVQLVRKLPLKLFLGSVAT